jgi:hypothetical protein
VRGLAQVAFQALEERRDIGAGGERKVLAADRAVACRVAEVRLLSSDGAGNADSGGYVLLGYAHFRFPR